MEDRESGLVWTQHQTQGRGSRGRSWLAPQGHGLALSLALKSPPFPDPRHLCFPLFAGVLLFDCLAAYAEPGEFQLKWPNDLLLRGRKLAGILCESRWQGKQARIVIGIGLNLKGHQDLACLPKGYASLELLASPPEAGQLVHKLYAALKPALQQYRAVTTLHQAWLARSGLRLGSLLKIEAYGRCIEGVFAGLDPLGSLLLDSGGAKPEVILQSCDDFQVITP